MKNLARVLFVFIICVAIGDGAYALEISGSTINSGNYILSEDISVLNSASFEAHDLMVVNSLHIMNYGNIGGGINVCENCVVEIRNVGTFGADVSLQNGAQFVQVITAGDEITNLGLSSEFDVSVRNGVGLDFSDVMNVATNADTIEFLNTDFDAGSFDVFVAPTNVKLSGNVILHFDDITNQSTLLFSNVSGDGVVHVDSSVMDSMHVFRTYRADNNVYVQLNRSTDYARIFNNDMGRFLNDLRASGTDVRLFSKLDSVGTMDEINDVLSHSFRTNPIKLMRPISLINSYKNLEIMHIEDDTILGLEPLIMYSSDVFIRGIRPNVSFSVDDLYLKLRGYVMDINFSDDVNEYGGVSFGIGGDAQYNMRDNNFVRAHIDGGKSFFHVGSVFTNDGVVNNPEGTSIYAGGEYGHIFDAEHGYTLSPFIGIGAEYMKIANMSDKSVYGTGGMDVGYEYDIDGLRYEMVVRALARTDETIGCGFNLSAWSVMDAAGADVHIGTIYNNDFGVSLTLSINGRFKF